MGTTRYKIIVAEKCTQTSAKICTWLAQEGYSVFPCADAYKVLRLSRQLLPALVLLDVNLGGMNPKQLIHIIETDQLSHVILLSESDNRDLRSLLSTTALHIQIHKPIEQGRFLHIMAQTLTLCHEKKKHQLLEERKNRDESKAFVIESAKAILMNKWHLTEDQSYVYLRKVSMDNCISIYNTALSIIKKTTPKS